MKVCCYRYECPDDLDLNDVESESLAEFMEYRKQLKCLLIGLGNIVRALFCLFCIDFVKASYTFKVQFHLKKRNQ